MRQPPTATLFPYTTLFRSHRADLEGILHRKRDTARGAPPHAHPAEQQRQGVRGRDRKSTRLNSSHANISYAVFCLKKKKHSLPYIFARTLVTGTMAIDALE